MRCLYNYRAVAVRRFNGQGGICGCYIGNRKGSGRGFNFCLGVDRLKGRLGKCRWAGFGVVKFVGDFKIGVIKLEISIIYSGVWNSIRIHAGWSVIMRWLKWGGKQKVGWWGGCFEGWLGRKLSDGVIQLVGSYWAKRGLFREQKLMICGCSIICSHVSSMLGCWVIMCWIGLGG